MIELYHFGFSSCSQKTRLVLEEKGLSFVSREIDLRAGAQHEADYVKLNPNHLVPTLVHDGVVLVESALIMKYLDDAFPEPPLRPAEPGGRYAVDLWMKRVDEALHPAAPALMFAIAQRPGLLAQDADAREAVLAKVHDLRKREQRRRLLEHGVKAPDFAKALGVVQETLDTMEETLQDQPWLSGRTFGLADATVVPYVLRLEHLFLDALIGEARRPAVAAWLSRMKARPSWKPAIEAWVPEGAVPVMRSLGEAAWQDVEPLLGH